MYESFGMVSGLHFLWHYLPHSLPANTRMPPKNEGVSPSLYIVGDYPTTGCMEHQIILCIYINLV